MASSIAEAFKLAEKAAGARKGTSFVGINKGLREEIKGSSLEKNLRGAGKSTSEINLIYRRMNKGLADLDEDDGNPIKDMVHGMNQLAQGNTKYSNFSHYMNGTKMGDAARAASSAKSAPERGFQLIGEPTNFTMVGKPYSGSRAPNPLKETYSPTLPLTVVRPNDTRGIAADFSVGVAGAEDLRPNGMRNTKSAPKRMTRAMTTVPAAEETGAGEAAGTADDGINETRRERRERQSGGGWWQRTKDRLKSKPNDFQEENFDRINSWTTQSGGQFDAEAGNAGRVNRKMYERINNNKENFYNDLHGAKTEEDFGKVFSDYGVNYESGMSNEAIGGNIKDHYAKMASNGPTLGDKANAYHVPGIAAAAVIGSAGIGLMSSKGQKSNSELYSDPFGQ